MSQPPSTSFRLRVPISSIEIGDRVRADYSHVEELSQSIAREGLIQPIVITLDNKLVAGGSRIRACLALGWTEIDVTYLEALPEDRLRILEVEENIRRKDFDWRERVQAVARIHELTARAKIVSREAKEWTMRQTGELIGCSVANVSYCVALAERIAANDKPIVESLTMTEALRVLIERKEQEANKLLALSTMGSRPAVGRQAEMFTSVETKTGTPFVGGEGIRLSSRVYLPGEQVDVDAATIEKGLANDKAIREKVRDVCWFGSCLDHMASWPPESVDYIVTDIPYGIDMSNLSQENTGMDVSSVEAEHEVAENWKLMRAFIPAAYKLLKPNAYCVLFYDLSMHNSLQLEATAAGFKVQRWPLFWVKTSSCLNQSAQFNFTKAVETAMVLRKGNATLVSPQATNWWMGGFDLGDRRFDHPFHKPVKLWQWIMRAVAIKGQTVYDPFSGVGSSTLAALEAGFVPLASEKNENHFSKLVANVKSFYESALCLPPTPTNASSVCGINTKSI